MALTLPSSAPSSARQALAVDTRSLNNLKLEAGQNSPDAAKEAAKQFESLFMRELIKSMREATMKSGLLDSAGGDLGTDMLVGRLGAAGKKICFLLSHGLMLWICYLLFAGSYAQAVINLDSTSAVMEVSMSWLYLPGMLFAILGGLIILTELLRLLGGKLRDDELVTIQESEETPHGGDQNKV